MSYSVNTPKINLTVKNTHSDNLKYSSRGSICGDNIMIITGDDLINLENKIKERLALYLDNGKKNVSCYIEINGKKVHCIDDRVATFMEKEGTCVFCGEKHYNTIFVEKQRGINRWVINFYHFDGNEYTLMNVDHILPVKKGGSNSINNYNVACLPCNSSKGDSLDENQKKDYDKGLELLEEIKKIYKEYLDDSAYDFNLTSKKPEPKYKHHK